MSDRISMTTIGEARAALTTGKRDDGVTFYHLTDDAPEWMRDLTYEAHMSGGIGPDDYRYSFIDDALGSLFYADGDIDEARDTIEPTVYTAKLTAWLASDNYRIDYCDEAIKEAGCSTINELLMFAYNDEQLDVFDSVVRSLAERDASEGREAD